MSAQSLTSKYRPRRFGDVAGQDAIKRILSRASAEDKIAPAYLFSGTRGVGKTTMARVLAKAINCEKAPAPEPCNECAQCRQITAGISPDVIEIDAATHGTVDEARRLKEDVGYAPLESRYKVFIIDEAHMLSKAAFNALLKTLEEPPGRVTFILATTEPHKILPTIISRCQHYVFKRLTVAELEAHLAGLLDRENVGFEPRAISLIARRGAGSVRDSMSLLAQVLAMGGESLREEDVRDALGLAGQDVFFSLMGLFKEEDCLGVSELLRQVLDRGLDIGFFLRELAAGWRNMFLLSQAGEKALPTLELAQEEARQWLDWAKAFDARHIHASWQMTLEGQRRVMTSLEPALALELLLLNLAYVPRLLSLENLARPSKPGAPQPLPRQRAKEAPKETPAVREAGQPLGPPSWDDFSAYLRAQTLTPILKAALPHLTGEFQIGASGAQLTITCANDFQAGQVNDKNGNLTQLQSLADAYFACPVRLEIMIGAAKKQLSQQELRAKAEDTPLFKEARETLGAYVIDVRPKN